MSCVYFVWPECDGRPVKAKIGYCGKDTPEPRIRSLQTGCPERLTHVHQTGLKQRHEMALHSIFEPTSAENEWRVVDDRLWALITGVRDGTVDVADWLRRNSPGHWYSKHGPVDGFVFKLDWTAICPKCGKTMHLSKSIRHNAGSPYATDQPYCCRGRKGRKSNAETAA